MRGPSLDYSLIPHLVGGRTGHGPLWVVWDTNVLSLYESYGRQLWDGEELQVASKHDSEQVEALGVLITMWLGWDIRIQVLGLTTVDSKRTPPREVRARRARSIQGLADALTLGVDGEETFPDTRPHGLPGRLVESFPRGKDRELIQDAYGRGADIFLTGDKGILKRDADVRPWGMRCLAPAALVDELLAAGLPLGFHLDYVLGLAPDLARMSALIAALPDD